MQNTIMLFDGVWRNAADNFFLINLIVFFQGTLFFDYKCQVIDSTEQEKTTYQNHTIFSAVNVPSVVFLCADCISPADTAPAAHHTPATLEPEHQNQKSSPSTDYRRKP